jgi:hypothetical protein
VITRAHTSQTGIDVVAKLASGETLHVEAKGQTSSRAGSAGFGNPFDSAAVKVNVAEAFCTAAASAGIDGVRSTMALPDDELTRRYVEPLERPRRLLEVGIFWVSDVETVALDAPWRLGGSSDLPIPESDLTPAAKLFYDQRLPLQERRRRMLEFADAGDSEARGYLESFNRIAGTE